MPGAPAPAERESQSRLDADAKLRAELAELRKLAGAPKRVNGEAVEVEALSSTALLTLCIAGARHHIRVGLFSTT